METQKVRVTDINMSIAQMINLLLKFAVAQVVVFMLCASAGAALFAAATLFLTLFGVLLAGG